MGRRVPSGKGDGLEPGSEKMETVLMPIRRAVLMTRHVISPTSEPGNEFGGTLLAKNH